MRIIRLKRTKLSMDLAPLIDVVFQLLIFFMLTSSFTHPVINLTLPTAKTIDKNVTQQIVISLQKNGEIFINTISVSMEEVEEKLAAMLEHNKNKSVHLKGDKEMPYKYFVRIMGLARKAGAAQINIIHQGEAD